jgi:hypothetical protein
VNTSIRRKLADSKRRIQRRLDKADLGDCSKPMMTAGNIHYEIAERSRNDGEVVRLLANLRGGREQPRLRGPAA